MPLWSILLSVARADTCDAYALADRFTVVGSPVSESSGVAASRRRPGVYFTHDDAGGQAQLYAFDAQGQAVGTHLVSGASLVDWEDLAPGPCPRDGEPCLYVGDIGDNDAERPTVRVYVAREPDAGQDARVVEVWEAAYPDGPHDAETLLVHPCTGEVSVVTKEDGVAGVYRLPADRSGDLVLERVADVAVPDARPITGGQWDPDGDRLVLRTRDRLWEWRTDPADPDSHWATPPVEVAEVDEDQGEAVAYTLDGALVTTGEGSPLAVHLLACEALDPAVAECTFVPTGCGCAQAPNAPPWPLLLLALAGLRRRPEDP